MRVLITSDVHANWEALEAVAAAGAGCEACICLGDVVGYGANPNETTAWVRANSAAVVRGNHDRACSGIECLQRFQSAAAAAARWTQAQLRPEQAEWLRALPAGPQEWRGLHLAHGSARDEDEYVLGRAEALAVFRATPASVQWFGHTHLQGGFALLGTGVAVLEGAGGKVAGGGVDGAPQQNLALKEGVRYLLNPGSVGQPRDGDWRAAFAVLDEEAGQVEFHRVAYALEQAQARILEAGLPAQLARRLAAGR